MYNPIMEMFIIIEYVDFKEVEYWDGSIEKTRTTRAKIPYGQVDVEEKKNK